MPRSLDPKKPIVFVLASDIDKPKETQPRFIGHHLDKRAGMELLDAFQCLQVLMAEQTGVIERLKKVDTAATAALMLCLDGWENMIDPSTGEHMEFNEKNLSRVLQLDEQMEALSHWMETFVASVDDKKKSE